jgi:hypothetical protein
MKSQSTLIFILIFQCCLGGSGRSRSLNPTDPLVDAIKEKNKAQITKLLSERDYLELPLIDSL